MILCAAACEFLARTPVLLRRKLTENCAGSRLGVLLTCASACCLWRPGATGIVRDEEVAGSNPVTPTSMKAQVTDYLRPGLSAFPGLSPGPDVRFWGRNGDGACEGGVLTRAVRHPSGRLISWAGCRLWHRRCSRRLGLPLPS